MSKTHNTNGIIIQIAANLNVYYTQKRHSKDKTAW